MFTGIIEEVGVVDGMRYGATGARLVVRAELAADVSIGQSVSVNGACLTVVEAGRGTVAFDVLRETLDRSNLADAGPGTHVNLERALSPRGRFDGHIVQGHVDAAARILSVGRAGPDREIWIEIPGAVARYLVSKGSVAVDGISLTVAALEEERFSVRIIPHTWEATALPDRRPGDRVNLEADILAKYVERLLGGRGASGEVTWETLRRAGFLPGDPS